MHAMRWAALAAAILLAGGSVGLAQESGGAPGASPSDSGPEQHDTGTSSRGGKIGGDLGVGGTGPGRNADLGSGASSSGQGR